MVISISGHLAAVQGRVLVARANLGVTAGFGPVRDSVQGFASLALVVSMPETLNN
jgi:hypothetical protein